MSRIYTDVEGNIFIDSCYLHDKPRDWWTYKCKVLKKVETNNLFCWRYQDYVVWTQGLADWSMLGVYYRNKEIKCFWTLEEVEEFILGTRM